MRIFVVFTTALLLLSLCSITIRAAEGKPTTDSVLTTFVNAIGGKDAWNKIESRSIKADVDFFGSSTEWKLQAKVPNKRRTEVQLGPLGLIVDGFDGTTAWSKSQAGLKTKDGDELSRAKKEGDFRREIRLKELYPGLELKGKETFSGEEVYVLESKPTPASKERFSFSAKSGLLVREQAEFKNAEGVEGAIETSHADYRDVDGLKYPYVNRTKISVGGQEFLNVEFKVKAIKHNDKFDDALFAPPTEAAPASATSVDVTGEWKVSVEVSGQSGEPEFTLNQENGKITGKYQGLLGEKDVTGNVEGEKIEFGFTTDQGKIAYTGTIEKDAMKGKTKYGDLDGTWSAKRKNAQTP